MGRRALRASLVGAVACLIGVSAPASAAVTDNTFYSTCGNINYGTGGALEGLAMVTYVKPSASNGCQGKARVQCQRQSDGQSQWQNASSWKGLNQLSSKVCSSPYNYARLATSALALG
jgi:hypothetical protein